MYTEIFKGRAFEIFDTSEINEVLLAAYGEFSRAVHNNVDLITLDKNALVQTKGGNILTEWPMNYGSTPIYQMARKSLLKILDLDKKVGAYFYLDYIDEDKIEIKFVISASPRA